MARKVGFLHNRTKASFQKHFAAFVGRLYDFVEEDDVIIVERWAGDDPGKSLEKHAAELAADVDVIVELLPVGEAATIGVLSNKERPLFEERLKMRHQKT